MPDIEKAYSYYCKYYGISERFFAENRNEIRTIFGDGSYWHDMRAIKEKCLQYIAEKDATDKVIVYLSDSLCNYRTDLVILLIDNS